MNNKDAEVIYNLIQLYMLEHDYQNAKKMIDYFNMEHENLIVVDKEMNRYDRKITLFTKAIETNQKK